MSALKTLISLFWAASLSASPAAVVLDALQLRNDGPGPANCGSWWLSVGPRGSAGSVNVYRVNNGAGCSTDLFASDASTTVPLYWYRLGGGGTFGPDAANFYSPISIGNGTRFATSVQSPWYVAFWLDASQLGGQSPGPGAGDYFGWAALVVDNTGLRVLSQGTDTSGRGIIVGSLTAVPEPAVLASLGLGALLSLRRRRR